MPDQQKIKTYDPRKEAIGSLLSMTNPSIIVPDWQRNFSWDSEQIETFWNDLVSFASRIGDSKTQEYFLGSVVIVRTGSGLLELLDGQQRLATSAIFVSCVRDLVKEFNSKAADQIQSSYLVGYDYVATKSVNKLRLNTYDREFFRQLVLAERTGEYTEPRPEIASHKLLANARAYFLSQLNSLQADETPKIRFDAQMRLLSTLLHQMSVIAVYSTDEDSAADVFETLNDRGIGLSTPDLLRNLVIRRAPEGQRDEIVELWRDVVSFETDAKIRNYLRHYWVSHHGDVKTQSLYREMKHVILADDINSLELSTQLSNSASNYNQIIGSDTDNLELNKVLESVAEFGASSRILYPVLLAIFETLDDTDKVRAATALLNVFVRHSVILQMENSRLENRIYRAARRLRTNKSAVQFANEILEGTPDDEEVKQAFARLSVLHNGTRRYLLKQIEMHLRKTEELEVSGSGNVHVEHIYPQAPVEGEKWREHARYLNRLGNLTLLSRRLNQSIKNSAFSQKKPHYEKSELELTRELCGYDDWTTESVNQRQEALAAYAAQLWPLS